jgi:ubiquinone/menaquinone biosynthesis C-methylase UbiE
MGWYDCFDFTRREFTQVDTKAPEIWRVLKQGGRLVCCSWEEQEDIRLMEAKMIQHYPALLEDREYLEERPIGMAYEKIEGYEIILRDAGFTEIEAVKETMTFVSTNEEEWWRQMRGVGWETFLDKIETDELNRVKTAIFQDLQPYKRADGFYFNKDVFFVIGVK